MNSSCIPNNSATKSYLIIFILIIVLAFSLRSIKFFLVDSQNTDTVAYITMANFIAKGDIAKAIHIRPELPPFYILLLASFKKLGLDIEIAGQLISIISSLLVVVAVFLIAKLVFNDEIALISAFFCAINNELLYNSVLILRETFALALMLFSVYFFMLAVKKYKVFFWIMSGILAAICSLTRPEGFEIVLAGVLWLFLRFFYSFNDLKVIRKYVLGIIIFLFIFLIFVLPIQDFFQSYGSLYTVFDYRKILNLYMHIRL